MAIKHLFIPEYLITDDGQIYSIKSGIWLKPTYRLGYQRCTLYNKGVRISFSLHRLVAQSFLNDYEESLEVNHKNGVKDDNRVSNLEMITPSANVYHSYRVLGRKVRSGRDIGTSKLSEEDVREIKKSTLTQTKLATMYNVTQANISSILTGKSWRHV